MNQEFISFMQFRRELTKLVIAFFLATLLGVTIISVQRYVVLGREIQSLRLMDDHVEKQLKIAESTAKQMLKLRDNIKIEVKTLTEESDKLRGLIEEAKKTILRGN